MFHFSSESAHLPSLQLEPNHIFSHGESFLIFLQMKTSQLMLRWNQIDLFQRLMSKYKVQLIYLDLISLVKFPTNLIITKLRHFLWFLRYWYIDSAERYLSRMTPFISLSESTLCYHFKQSFEGISISKFGQEKNFSSKNLLSSNNRICSFSKYKM